MSAYGRSRSQGATPTWLAALVVSLLLCTACICYNLQAAARARCVGPALSDVATIEKLREYLLRYAATMSEAADVAVLKDMHISLARAVRNSTRVGLVEAELSSLQSKLSVAQAREMELEAYITRLQAMHSTEDQQVAASSGPVQPADHPDDVLPASKLQVGK